MKVGLGGLNLSRLGLDQESQSRNKVLTVETLKLILLMFQVGLQLDFYSYPWFQLTAANQTTQIKDTGLC
jgi:hypothetical protein